MSAPQTESPHLRLIRDIALREAGSGSHRQSDTPRDRLLRGVGFREALIGRGPKRTQPSEEISIIITDVPGRTTLTEEPDGSTVVAGALIRISGRPDDDESSVLLPSVLGEYVSICFEEPGATVAASAHLSDGHWFVSSVGPARTKRVRGRKG